MHTVQEYREWHHIASVFRRPEFHNGTVWLHNLYSKPLATGGWWLLDLRLCSFLVCPRKLRMIVYYKDIALALDFFENLIKFVAFLFCVSPIRCSRKVMLLFYASMNFF